jgi:hypothetical protein
VSGPGLALPLLLVALAAYALVVVLAVTAVRSRDLPRSVAAARRYGTTTGAVAVVSGVVAAALTAVLGPLEQLGSGVTALAVPAVYATTHTLVLLAGEAGWPRPRGPVRSADLTARTAAQVSSPRWRRLLWSAAAAVALVCVLGWVTADADGRSVTVGPRGPLPEGATSSTASPYPGAVFAVPALVAAALLVVLVVLGLRLVASRPAVDGAARGDEAVLRRASAHRLLRGACTGLLATAGGMLAFGGAALHSAAQPVLGGVQGDVALSGGSPVLSATGSSCLVLGVLLVVAALVVAHLPAPRLGGARSQAAPSARGSAP